MEKSGEVVSIVIMVIGGVLAIVGLVYVILDRKKHGK